MPYAIRVEYANERKIRERNKRHYRFAHWPIWIFVFFLAPGPLVFRLFARGASSVHLLWLVAVLAGTGLAGYLGQLPGVEPRPYILRFCEDKPNPLYRRICYTFAWNALLNFALLNLAGLVTALMIRRWEMKRIYMYGYFPVMLLILGLGAVGRLPRAGQSTEGEGSERRYFYGAVWSITAAQIFLLILWKALPNTHAVDIWKTVVFIGTLSFLGGLSAAGILPRTRPILPGEIMVAD